ncbi:type I restriction enzyme S subunit [Sphingomonas sp. PP-CE-3G-477]|nr:type I restriction enzyme S subunit [Sphingomonas sp. PP-CE-3G-477]
MMLARAFPVVETLVPMAINQDLKAVNPKPGMTSSFLAWTLRGTARESLDRCSEAGHGTKALRMEDWLTMPFPAPPSEEQVSIAAFLDRETGKIDALIEEQRCLIALLKEKRQAVVSHGVTKGLNPDAPVKDSGIEWLGDIPAHWEARKLTAVARLESGHTPSRQRPEYWVEEDCVIPWFTLADVNQLRSGRFPRISGTTQRISELGMANSAARLLPAGTVILSRTASVGFSGIAEIDLAVSQDFAAWVCEGRLNAAFLLIVLQAMRPEFARLMMGSTHQTIYMPDIEAFKIPLPPEAEQAQIIDHVATALTSIDALTDACEAAIGLLHERRAALISAAVTGKIDVRESAKILQFPIDRARARRFVATEIIERLAHQTTFGRTKLQKVAYLAEAHANITELAGCYLRMPYGPLDQPMMDEIEAAGGDTGILVDDKHDGTMVRYRPTGKKGEHAADLRKWLGEERFNKLDHLIMALSDLKTHAAEAIATLYAVWNDALIEGKSFTDEEIISAFFGWHPKKGDNFRADELPHWLDWMRRHGIIPTGSGPKTISKMGALL